MSAAVNGLRGWLLAEAPGSKWQARCQRLYIGWLAFRRNPIAMLGLLIIVALIGVALFAPLITSSDGLEPEPTPSFSFGLVSRPQRRTSR